MATEELVFACEINDRTQPLFDGTVEPEGFDMNFLPLRPEETFWRMLQYGEFDCSEMSMSSYMAAKDGGESNMIAVPVFPSRIFRHANCFVNADAGIDDPEDLIGADVGVPEYQMTAAMWQRGILQHEYGVHPSDVRWYQGGLERPESDSVFGNTEDRVELHVSEDVERHTIAEDDTLNRMLETGEIDALIGGRAPSSFYESDAVERLFPDFASAEKEYYRKTGFFPIMHTVVFRRDVYDEDPWLAQQMVKAFIRAKSVCYQRLDDSGVLNAAIPWLHADLEEARSIMGEDYWPYGVENNREELEMMTQMHYEQGLSSEKHDVDDLFAPNTYDRYQEPEY